jgi:proteasome lid subunit RPN8/RPN11
MPRARICSDILRMIQRHAENAFPQEACGLVLGAAGRARRAVPLPNSRAPTAQARSSFEMEPEALLQALRRGRRLGERVLWIYHSHVGCGAAFSAEDARRARSEEGAPFWPGVRYLVLSVSKGRVMDLRWAFP